MIYQEITNGFDLCKLDMDKHGLEKQAMQVYSMFATRKEV